MNNSQLFPIIAALSKGGGGGGSYSTDDFIDNYNADDSNVTAEKDENDKLILIAAGGTGAVDSVNGKTGDVELVADDIPVDNSTSVQDNLERIDEELGRLEDEKQNLIQSVEITGVPSTATSGTLTEEQLATLQADKENVLVFNNEIYKLNDNGHEAGALGYSHSGVENGVFMLKNITVTISTLGWVLTEQEVEDPSGAAWGSITGTLSNQTDLQDALNGKANAVDGDMNRVQEANEIYTTTSQSQTDAFIFRTAAGAMSINSGAATISTVYGNTVQTGHTDEVLTATGNFQTEGTTVSLNKTTFRALSLENGTYTFIYDDAWKLNDAAVTLSDYGLTVTGTVVNGDAISVEYVALVIGTLSTAKPTAFKATGFNQYNATAGYAHVVGGNQYRVGGTYTQVQFSTTPTGTKTTLTVENNKFTPEEDGYIFVTGSGNILVALVWSGTMDSEPWSAYSDNGFNVPTTDADGNNLPTATYGFPSVHGVRDEIDFAGKIYQQRIGHYAYSAENLATVEALGVDYIYDLSDIFYVLPDLVLYELASDVSGVYEVNDYGTEEWVGTSVPMTTVITYGNSLVDKLRNLADIQIIGTGLTLNANGELSAEAGGGGGVKVLTTADYNWPADNPTMIVLPKLGKGIYVVDSSLVISPWSRETFTVNGGALIIIDYNQVYSRYHTMISQDNQTLWYVTDDNGETRYTSGKFLKDSDIINNVVTTDGGYALDARQGKVLKDLIDALDARVTALEG